MNKQRSRGLGVALTLAALLAVAPLGFAQDASILEDPSRTDRDRERDPGSKPLEVYAFFGIEPGMTVVDLMPGRGYNTHILSNLVGDSGKVYAGPDRRGAVAERVQAAGLDNVEIISDIGDIEPGSVDVILTVRNLHDLELRLETGPIYAGYLEALKPGGVFGVVDARTPKDGVDDESHRINQDFVIANVTDAGFELVDTSEMLANADDDFSKWEGQGVRTEVDRMVLKFRRPTG